MCWHVPPALDSAVSHQYQDGIDACTHVANLVGSVHATNTCWTFLDASLFTVHIGYFPHSKGLQHVHALQDGIATSIRYHRIMLPQGIIVLFSQWEAQAAQPPNLAVFCGHACAGCHAV